MKFLINTHTHAHAHTRTHARTHTHIAKFMGFGCLCPLEPPLFSIDKNIIVVDMLIGVFQFNMASSLAQWFERAIKWRGVGGGGRGGGVGYGD